MSALARECSSFSRLCGRIRILLIPCVINECTAMPLLLLFLSVQTIWLRRDVCVRGAVIELLATRCAV